MKQTVIFPHVPKAGGTSIKVQLEQSGLKVLMDYKAPPGDTVWHQRKSRLRDRQLRELDVAEHDLVFGHFPVNRYHSPDYRYVALVRHPVERAISQYFYHISRSTLEHLKPQRRAFYAKVASGEIGFLDYCRRTDCATIYRAHLNLWPRERFALVGNTGDYARFIERFNRMLGTALSGATHLRKREEASGLIPEEDIALLRLLLKDEIEWYDRFVSDC